MRTIFKVLCAMLVLTFSLSTVAQKKSKEVPVTIKYAITYEGEIDAQTKAQLPNEAVMYVKGTKMRMDQKSPLYSIATISELDGPMTILFSGMGQNIATSQSKEEIDKAKAEMEQEEEKLPQINILDETKTIAGYKCKKAEIVNEEGGSMEVFFTEEIAVPESFFEMSTIKGLKGIPMEYSQDVQGMVMTMTVKEVKTGKIADTLFKITDDYTTVSFEEFTSSLGGGM